MAAAPRHDCPECNAVMDSVRYLEGPLRELQKDPSSGRFTQCHIGTYQEQVGQWKMYSFQYAAQKGRVPPRYDEIAFLITVGAQTAHDGRHAVVGWLAEYTAYPQAVLLDVLRRATFVEEPSPQDIRTFGCVEHDS